MPELPEVETVVRTLRPLLVGKRLGSLERGHPGVVDNIGIRNLNRRIANRRVRAIERRGKLLLFLLDGDIIVIHLRMTGRLIPLDGDAATLPHTAARIHLKDGGALIFQDVRKFGRIYYFKDRADFDSRFPRLGPEPLAPDFSAARLHDSLQKRHSRLKPLLLNQDFLAGLGNIYVDEILWRARLHPWRIASTIDRRENGRLFRALQAILIKAIAACGTTFRDFTFLGEKKGEYFRHLKVYGRQGDPCPRCSHIILKYRCSGRGTHICPHCQQWPELS